MNVMWILVAVVGQVASGTPALLLGARSRAGMVIGAALNVLASAVGFAGLILFVMSGEAGSTWDWQWGLPMGRFAVGIDAMGVVFLIPIFLISALGSIYGLAYWPQRRHPGNGQRLRLCWGLLAGSMAMVVLARDAILFLMAWEVMALSAYMLVATEDHKKEVRQAAWVYLVATHLGTLCLLGFFALLHGATGSWAIWQTGGEAMHLSAGQASSLTALPLTAMLILALLGFGMKAGIFPLHVWLPGAHANAPSHVSAALSGVMLKMGVYGVFRATGLVAHPPAWWGGVILAVGVLSALVGIVYAVGQQDYKRMLAYSSIENVGIIMMGLGLALLGRAAGQAQWVVLGMGAALFHVLNHSLFKPLLFMGAGSLLHGVHTRRIDRLGGLAKRMPLTFVLFVAGSIAICGLPPLNGFASELLLYLGLLDTARAPVAAVGGMGAAWGWAALGVPALAAVGALAVAGFVKLLGCVFQGEPRTGKLAHAHDPPAGMWMPMLVLAGLCLAIGIFPAMVLPVVQHAMAQWNGPGAAVRLDAITPLGWLTWTGLALAGGIGAVGLVVAMLMRKREWGRSGTWDCGYARPSARMQYTAASFAQMIMDLVAWALWPRGGVLRLQTLFAARKRFSLELPDLVLERGLLPGFAALRRGAMFVRRIQLGSVQAYIVCVLVIIVLLVLLG